MLHHTGSNVRFSLVATTVMNINNQLWMKKIKFTSVFSCCSMTQRKTKLELKSLFPYILFWKWKGERENCLKTFVRQWLCVDQWFYVQTLIYLLLYYFKLFIIKQKAYGPWGSLGYHSPDIDLSHICNLNFILESKP